MYLSSIKEKQVYRTINIVANKQLHHQYDLMKKFILFLFTCMALLPWQGTAQKLGRNADNFIRSSSTETAKLTGFGYADRSLPLDKMVGIGTGKVSTLIAAIELPEMGGNLIKGLSFAVDKADPTGAIVIMDAQYKVLVCEETPIKRDINNIAFSTPFEMKSGEKYFVGYQIHSTLNTSATSHPLFFDGKKAIKQAEGIGILEKNIAVGETVKMLPPSGGGSGVGAVMLFADIEDRQNVLQDIGILVDVTAKPKVYPREKVTLTAEVRNLGKNEINSLLFSIQLGDKEQTVKVQSQMAPWSGGEIQFDIEYPATGEGKASVRLLKVNDKKYPFDEEVISIPYQVLEEGAAFAKNSVLIEQFTSESCGNCPASEPILQSYVQALQEKGIKVSYIQHHAGYIADFLTLPESEALLPYLYPKGKRFAPAFALDRIVLENGVCAAHVGHEKKVILDAVANSLQYGNFTSIEQKYEGGMLSLVLKGKLVNGVDPNNLYITAVLTEDNVASKRQSGAGPSWVHQHVPRLYLSAALGTKALVEGNEFTLTLPAKVIDVAWKTEDLKLVLFATKQMAPKNLYSYGEREILFSTNLTWGENILSNPEIEEPKQPIFSVADGYISISEPMESVEIYAMDGSLIGRSCTVRLPSGVYIVKMMSKGKTLLSKVIVP